VGLDDRYEFSGCERVRETNASARARFDNIADAVAVVIVPVADDDQTYSCCDVDSEVLKVGERDRNLSVTARVDYNPLIPTDVCNDALSDSRSEDRDFKLIGRGPC
jgi:hypothetical protein